MSWLLGGLLLVVVGVLLRRALRLGSSAAPRPAGLEPLRPELQTLYCPIAQEVETHTAILGISLNDAFDEREASRLDMAWHMVQLSAGEWSRLAEIVTALLNALTKHLPNVPAVVPAHRIVPEHFKSQLMADHMRMYEFLDRLLYRSPQRFQLRVRLLRRAAESLTKEFRHTYRYMEKTQDHSPEIWARYDLYFHDFDLIAKETLLAFRTLLACLPSEVLGDLGVDLQLLLQRGVRTHSVPVDR
jgi:hypothetical protein